MTDFLNGCKEPELFLWWGDVLTRLSVFAGISHQVHSIRFTQLAVLPTEHTVYSIISIQDAFTFADHPFRRREHPESQDAYHHHKWWLQFGNPIFCLYLLLAGHILKGIEWMPPCIWVGHFIHKRLTCCSLDKLIMQKGYLTKDCLPLKMIWT